MRLLVSNSGYSRFWNRMNRKQMANIEKRDSKCKECNKYNCQCESKTQWFKTSSPLPDGDYGWRLKKGNDIHICVVVDGLIYGTDDFPGVFQCDTCKKKKLIHTTLEPTIFNRGEWYRIVWPD